MKIAHVGPEYYPAIGGVGQVMRELAERQASEGHEVHVFVPDWDKQKRIKKKEEIINGVYIHRCQYWFRAANFMTFWPSLFLKLSNEKFDVIHSHLFAHPHFVIAALVAKIKGIPHIHTTHCPWSDAPRSLVGRLGILISYNIFSRAALKLTYKIIAITPWENKFIERFGGKKEKIANIPNGMSNEFFIKAKNNNFKEKLKIKKTDKIVLFFGRLSFTKSPDKFVDIAKEILKERRDIIFIIRGPDEGMKKIVKEKIGDEKRILLLSETRDRKEIIKMYQSSDVFVMPSYREGLPLTLFEAMASGLPIVATPVNGIPFEIKDGENGFLVEYKNNIKFAKKIVEILDNRKLRERISKKNIEKSRNYNWDKIARKTLDIYKEEIRK